MTGSARTAKRVGFVGAILSAVAALALSGNTMAETGVQCPRTGMETVATERDHYQAGEVARISGSGYATGCDVEVAVERPDGVVESFTSSTGLGGSFALDYTLPAAPGVLGEYRVVVRGLGGVELASTTFADAPAPQFDVAPTHVATTGSHVFTALVRNTANAAADTARCIRVTLPSGYSVTGATFVVANPGTGSGQTGTWELATGANFAQLRTTTAGARGIFGSAITSDNWVRFEITATTPSSAGSASWTARMLTTNTSCASGGSSDALAVSVAQTSGLAGTYSADFRDGSNAVIASPSVNPGDVANYRIRITRVSGGNDLSYAVVALPTCFTNINGVSTTDSGPPHFEAELTDNVLRLRSDVNNGVKLASDGQWVQVHFTATADCPSGSHVFRTAAWKNTSPETSQGDIFRLVAGTGHPTLTVTADVDDPPTAVNDTATVAEDAAATTIDVLANDTDPDGGAKTIQSVTQPANGTVLITNGGADLSYKPNADYCNDGNPTDNFSYTLNGGSSATVAVTVTCVNDAPTVDAGNDASGAEGSAIALDGTVSDVEGDDVTTTSWSYVAGAGVDAGATCSFADASAVDTTITCTDDGTYTATLTATDEHGAAGSDSVEVTVTNVAPVLNSVTPSSYTAQIGTAVTVTGEYTDAGVNDTHVCIVNWDDGTAPETVAGVTVNGSGSCSAARTFTTPGVYTVSLKVVDDDDGESNSMTVMISVFDPNGGFVTGGGWFISPPGAYTADPTSTGRANFGFNSKYHKGAKVPSGQTEFQFKAGNLNFHSDAYEWLVVAGAKAQYKGSGTLNGVSGYKFMLTAVDGQAAGGGGADKFRIKITDSAGIVVYDNRMGASDDIDAADPQTIGGGAIVIHKG